MDSLYGNKDRVTRNNLSFADGVAEVGGAEHVSPLWIAQEERPKWMKGEDVYGRVKEGIVVVPEGYIANPAPFRALVQFGLPLINPKQAVEANTAGRLYSPDEESAKGILKALRSAVVIDERDIKDNILELMLGEFTGKHKKYTLALYGGEGTQEQRIKRVENARDYFGTHFQKAKKINKSQKVFLPRIDSAVQGIVGTQLLVGGLDYEFDLSGDNRGLQYAVGVFGV